MLLLALVAASIFQVGILWSESNEGFMVPFAAGTTAGHDSGARASRHDLELSEFASIVLNPYRITISDGGQFTQGAHYLISRKSDLFSIINARCRAFFEDIMTITPETDLPVELWGDLVSNRGVLVEFREAIPQDVIKWLIGRQDTAQGTPAEINKLLIVPEEISGRYSICLYILADDRITRVISTSVNYFDMQKIINDSLYAFNSETRDEGIRYMTIHEVGGGRFPGFAPDVFCVVEGPKANPFRSIRYAAPADVRDKTELENIILTSDIYSYNRSIGYNGDLEFKNITNIYRLYKNGLMEYNYLPLAQPAEKGDVAPALENAVAYILNIEKQLLGSADLVLSGIFSGESDSAYRFTFDYIIDDYPVLFRAGLSAGASGGGYQNAVSIQANANRVISCRWMLVDLFFASATKQFHVYFDRIDIGRSMTRMAVSDIAIAYVVNLAGGADEPGGAAGYDDWPVWAITSPDGYVETVALSEG